MKASMHVCVYVFVFFCEAEVGPISCLNLSNPFSTWHTVQYSGFRVFKYLLFFVRTPERTMRECDHFSPLVEV